MPARDDVELALVASVPRQCAFVQHFFVCSRARSVLHFGFPAANSARSCLAFTARTTGCGGREEEEEEKQEEEEDILSYCIFRISGLVGVGWVVGSPRRE